MRKMATVDGCMARAAAGTVWRERSGRHGAAAAGARWAAWGSAAGLRGEFRRPAGVWRLQLRGPLAPVRKRRRLRGAGAAKPLPGCGAAPRERNPPAPGWGRGAGGLGAKDPRSLARAA